MVIAALGSFALLLIAWIVAPSGVQAKPAPEIRVEPALAEAA
jgi:hypothetical protein